MDICCSCIVNAMHWKEFHDVLSVFTHAYLLSNISHITFHLRYEEI
jgi:hypothetical protein